MFCLRGVCLLEGMIGEEHNCDKRQEKMLLEMQKGQFVSLETGRAPQWRWHLRWVLKDNRKDSSQPRREQKRHREGQRGVCLGQKRLN